MDNGQKKIIFFTIFAIVILGVGGYYVYTYEQIKKANATVVSVAQARAMAADVLKL